MHPQNVTIAAGGRVTFTNTDNGPHDVQGGVDIDHPDCHEIDAVGFLTPGQTKTTNPLPTIRTCGYHDHQFHAPGFDGQIVIQ